MAEFPSPRLRVALRAYGVLWWVLLPVVLAYLRLRARKDPLYAAHLAERFGHHTPMPGAVWVHAVSLGEVRSAVPLIEALLARGERVIVTHFTPAGRRETARVFAAAIAEGRVRAAWVPFDTARCLRRFLAAFTPEYGLVMEIEVWPAMILAARKAGVPLFMCNAQYPSTSAARDKDGLRAELMRGFAGALVKSQVQADRFARVGVSNIAVTGELRFDQPVSDAQVAAGHAAQPRRAVIAFASVVEGEDQGFLSVIKALRDDAQKRSEQPPLFVHIPRKPERFEAVADLLATSGLRVVRRSVAFDADLRPTASLDDADILLGDSLGEMYFYLALATRVVIGGGFTPGGSHNISEPLALGLPPLTGPDTHTIEYPFVEAEAAGVALSVADFGALATALALPPHATKDQCDTFYAAHSGATRRTLEAIPSLLTTSRKNRRPH